VPFTGEKEYGELGIARNYHPDFSILSMRSWQLYHESEIAQIVINNYLLWIVGAGLKLQAQPSEEVLRQEGVSKVNPNLAREVESRFNIFCKSKYSDYKQRKNIHLIAKEAQKHALIGGDCVVVMRYDEEIEMINVQLIDGYHLTGFNAKPKGGNIVQWGVELDGKGRHVAYHVRTKLMTTERIPVYGNNTGRLQAFMIYGSEYRCDNVRGLPLFSAVMQTIAMIDRYKEATVGSAEERQKNAYHFEHDINSTGEDPIKSVRENLGRNTDNPNIEKLVEQAKQDVKMSSNKTVSNLPPGVTMKMLESKNELHFKDFYEVNFVFLCAALMIPPEVALNKYDSNYSSSRAAIKSWEYRIKIGRSEFGYQYYQPIYNLFFEIESIKGKINAPGYLSALINSNKWIIAAYTSCRWVGVNVPHIDPMKEVMAIRKALGDDATPLTTYEMASEMLNFGEWDLIIEQVKQEKKEHEIKETGNTSERSITTN